MECSHEVMLSNQLVGIYASEIGPRMQLAAAHALYVAVDRCRDMVHVTDDQHVVKVSFLAFFFVGNKNRTRKMIIIKSSNNCLSVFFHY